jgi:hypothetical protein
VSYQYDIFVSYTHGGEAGEWVRNHFEPRLRGSLELYMASEPRIFWDRDIEAGALWPDTLREALLRSRFIVPVFSHPYFRSRWCVAELNTMIAREDALGGPTKLVYPVKFFGEGFPDEIEAIEYEDLSTWAYPSSGFQHSERYLDFTDAVRAFSGRLAQRLPNAPEWADGWPVRLPEVAPRREVAVPRL